MRQPAVLAKRRTRLPLCAISIICRRRPSIRRGPATGFTAASRRGGCGRSARCRIPGWPAAASATATPVRLTLDYDLRARPRARPGSRTGDGRAGRCRSCTILELKYQGTAPAIFRRLVEEFALTPQPASKYRLGARGAGPAGAPILSAPRRADPGVVCLSSCAPSCRRPARPCRCSLGSSARCCSAPSSRWIYQRDAAGERDVVVARRDAGAAVDPDRDGHAGDRRQRRARVQPGRRAVDRRFRTVVRDTQDTAFVIFAVAVGMAVGASHPAVALSAASSSSASAAWIMTRGADAPSPATRPTCSGAGRPRPRRRQHRSRRRSSAHARSRRLMSLATAKQGMAIEVVYASSSEATQSAGELVKALNRIEGVQSVSAGRDITSERVISYAVAKVDITAMNNQTRQVTWITIAAGRTPGHRRRAGRLRPAHRGISKRRRGPGPRRRGFQGPPPFGPGGRRPWWFRRFRRTSARLSPSSTRTATSGSTSRAQGRARVAGVGPRRARLRASRRPGGFGGRGGMVPGITRAEAGARGRQVVSDAPLYDVGTLRTIFLQFENADWEKELAAFNNTDVEVPATVTVDGKIYKNVGVHFRGASSFMMVPEGSKRSLNLAFDFVDEKQAARRLSHAQPAERQRRPDVRPRRSSIPRSRSTTSGAQGQLRARRHQRRELGRLRQRAAVQQGLHARLLQEHEGRALEGARAARRPRRHGVLGDDAAAYKRIYEIKTKDDPKSWADLIRLFKVLNETPADKLEAALDADPRHRRRVEVPRARRRARQQRRLLDARQRLQHLPGREGTVPRHPARHERGPRRRRRPRLRSAARIRSWWTAAMARCAAPGGPGGPGRARWTGGAAAVAGCSAAASADLDPLVGLNDATKPLRSKLLAVPALRQRYCLRARDRREVAGLEDARPARAAVSGAHRRRREGGHAEAVQHRGVHHRRHWGRRQPEGFVEKRRAFLLK